MFQVFLIASRHRPSRCALSTPRRACRRPGLFAPSSSLWPWPQPGQRAPRGLRSTPGQRPWRRSCRGRWIQPGHPDEVLVNEAFASAHRLGPRHPVGAIVNGRRRRLRSVGPALSLEYVYLIPPGELIRDDRRFDILWIERWARGAAFDMGHSLNDVVPKLAPGASVEKASARLDRPRGPPAQSTHVRRAHLGGAAIGALRPAAAAGTADDSKGGILALVPALEGQGRGSAPRTLAHGQTVRAS